MKNSLFVTITSIFLLSAPLFAQEQQKEKEPEELAAEEATRLEKLLSLEPHQTFFIDSILQHDMRGLYDEMQEMNKSGMREYTAYKTVRERWIAQMEAGYQKIFTPEQWNMYLKSQGKLKKEKPDKKNKEAKKGKEEKIDKKARKN